MTMLERVARALHKNQWGGAVDWDENYTERENCLSRARAAKDARAVEKKTHQSLVLDGKSLSGEWFDIRPKEAFDLVQFNAALLGIELSTEIPDDRIRAELSKALTKIDRRRIEAQPEPEISEDYD